MKHMPQIGYLASKNAIEKAHTKNIAAVQWIQKNPGK